MESLLSLPDDVLIYKVFPQYDVSYLLHLCQINQRFSIICQNNDLWHILVKRDIGIDIMPEGFNNWRDVYMFYNHLLNDPHDAIPYIEATLLQKREGGNLTFFQQQLLNKYKNNIIYISYQGAIIYILGLYNRKTDTLMPITPLDQVRILQQDENIWRNINISEMTRYLGILYYFI
jgi:hypothetical protein